MVALLQVDPFSAEFWKNLPSAMTAAKDNPWGVIAAAILVLSLVALALSAKMPPKMKYIFFVTLIAAIFGVIYAGNVQIETAKPREMTISGRVVNQKTGKPVPRAIVSLSTTGVPRKAQTNSDGFWVVDHFQAPRGINVIKMSVDATDFNPHEADLAIADIAQPPTVMLVPHEPPSPPPGPNRAGPAPGSSVTLAGRVFTEDREGVVYADVLFQSGGSPPHSEATSTGEQGNFRLKTTQLRLDSNLKITVSKKGFRTVTRSLSPGDARQFIEIKLAREGSN